MHRHDAFQRKRIIEDGEYGFLDFTSVRRVSDETQPLSKVESNKCIRGCAINDRDSFERRDAHQGEFWHVPAILVVGSREDEHVARKEGMPGVFTYNPYGHAVLRIGSCKAILHKDILPLQESLHPIDKIVEFFHAEGAGHIL